MSRIFSGDLGERGPSSVVTEERVEDLSGDESLQTANDVFLGESLSGASGDVVDGRLMPTHAHDDDAIERRVGLAVAAAKGKRSTKTVLKVAR